MSEYLIAIKDRDGNYFHTSVAKEVYQYIKQLEAYIENPDGSKIKETYPDRFASGGIKDA